MSERDMIEIEDALPVEPAQAAQWLLYAIAGLFVVALVWSATARLDKVTRGIGRVVPSNQLQEVQYLEGGIVKEILVSAGDQVSAGEVLVRLDPTRMSAEFAQGKDSYQLLSARILRLQALAARAPLTFPESLRASAPGIVGDEKRLYDSRLAEYNAATGVARAKLADAKSRLRNADEAWALAQEEMRIIRPLVEKGIEPRIELIRVRQREVAAEGEAQSAKISVDGAQEELRQAETSFLASVGDELARAKAEMASIAGDLPALEDSVARTEVKAPIDGVVNRVLVSTIGGVMQPGQTILEIVPSGDTLLVEAEIKPADIAFLRLGQEARVRITAFDSSVYGALEGRIEQISPDAIKNEETRERYYLIKVRTEVETMKANKADLRILPGMAAEVDILNGKRTVLSYLLNPIADLQSKALRDQ
ncbi:MAG: HlyD family type I secretion periplasmic adaptor subunit [Parvularculaceae bacterium]